MRNYAQTIYGLGDGQSVDDYSTAANSPQLTPIFPGSAIRLYNTAPTPVELGIWLLLIGGGYLWLARELKK